MTYRLLPRCASMLLLLAGFRVSADVDVVIRDVDVTHATVGQAVVVPVDVHGVDPASFAAFQFEFGLDPAAYELQDVERGALIAAQDDDLAFPLYAPWLWALEARQDGAVLRVAGLILMPDAQAQQGNLNTLSLARVGADHGELLRLRLVLRTLTPTPITLVSAGANLVVEDDATEAGEPVARATANVLPGGTVLGGLPNHWVYRYFGTAGCNPDSDPDGDRVVTRAEYAADTNPVVPDVRLDLGAGWNFFSLPVTPAEPQPAAVLSTAHRREQPDAAPGVPVYEGLVWGWSGRPLAWHMVKADALQPLQAYWVYAVQPVSLVIPGVPCGTGSLSLQRGWNLVGAVADTDLGAIAGAPLRAAWRWDPANGFVPATVLQRSLAYWLFAPRAMELPVDPGPMAP